MAGFVEGPVTVTVPATSANLGPGFDCLGLALDLRDRLVGEVTGAGLQIEVSGEGAGEVPGDETHLVVRAMHAAFDAIGARPRGLRLECTNVIPHSRGLGSSSAAIVGGIALARALVDQCGAGVVLTDEAALVLADELEGHPDNVAPALFGGLTIAWVTPEGPQSKKLMVHRGVSTLVLVPEHVMSTALARSLQPAHVPHADAVFNLSRSALLVAALTQSPELLLAATEDKLHQNYRASAMPETHLLVTMLREHGFAAVVSGAGPSVLVLCSDPGQRLAAAELVAAHSETRWQPLMLAVDFKGATVTARVPAATSHAS